MARSPAQKKSKKPKSRAAVSSGKKAKPKAAKKIPKRKPASKPKAAPAKTKRRGTPGAKRKTPSSARRPAQKRKVALKTGSRKKVSKAVAVPRDTPPPRLLRRTKTTAAALALLEKGIELIYKRDFKKARGQLQTLLETYPGEMEILARARSYMQICKREEAAQKKPPASTDQLYALGILEHNRANYDAALAYFRQSLETHPEADYIYYSVAASLAMKGNLSESMENLCKAVELNEDSRIYAKNDGDFSALQTHKEFVELVGAGLPPDAKSEP